MTFDLTVEYEDGSTEQVRADQRDCVAYELKQRIGTNRALDEQPVVFMRWIAWHALKRLGKTDLTREQFEKVTVSVDSDEGPEDADPTSAAASGDSSSD